MRDFDLDGAILAWRDDLERLDVFDVAELDELEDHLRERVDDLQRRGLAAAEALAQASALLGEGPALAAEYAKVRRPAVRRWRTCLMVYGFLGGVLLIDASFVLRMWLAPLALALPLVLPLVLRRRGLELPRPSGLLAIGITAVAAALLMRWLLWYQGGYWALRGTGAVGFAVPAILVSIAAAYLWRFRRDGTDARAWIAAGLLLSQLAGMLLWFCQLGACELAIRVAPSQVGMGLLVSLGTVAAFVAVAVPVVWLAGRAPVERGALAAVTLLWPALRALEEWVIPLCRHVGVTTRWPLLNPTVRTTVTIVTVSVLLAALAWILRADAAGPLSGGEPLVRRPTRVGPASGG